MNNSYENSSISILLVDDDDVDRQLVIRTLKKCQITAKVTEANTVDKALKLYAEQAFDVVLLDYSMPQRDGMEMIIEIRSLSHNKGAAIVMMSVCEEQDLAMQCIQAGAQDFLMKSEINEVRLTRALLHATARFELEKKLFEVRLKAETDPLTQLPNRYFFDEAFKQAIANCRRNQINWALILFDLDHFKEVNDSYGHYIGDQLLKQVVTRVKSCLRDNEVLSRIGGDEFAITLTHLHASESAGRVAQRILALLQKPFELEGHLIQMTASIGIAVESGEHPTGEAMFKFADIALYRAKKQGRNQLCFFESTLQQKYQKHMQTEAQLHHAIEQQQLRLYFQPMVTLHNRNLLGVEALLRWQTANGLLMPAEFLFIAAESRQICDIDCWVLASALSTLAKWNASGDKQYLMAINVSDVELSNKAYVQNLVNALQHHAIPPWQLQLEFSESALSKDTGVTAEVLQGLHQHGVKLVLDDFGTGLSSFTQLNRYPISAVKIDPSMMPVDDSDSQGVRRLQSLVAMLDALGIEAIAEGVETSQHVALCQKLAIKVAQGFYFAAPQPADVIEKHYLPDGKV